MRIALPKLAKGQKIEIQRSAATKKAKFARIATSKASSYTDRKVRRRHTYRYRLILVAKDGSRSLPSRTLPSGSRALRCAEPARYPQRDSNPRSPP